MTDIQHALVELASEIEFPTTPDLLYGVTLDRPASGRRLRRRAVVVALAALVAALALGLALSPGARSAFRELFGLGGVEIVRLEEAPPAASARIVPFGHPVTFEQASRSVPFRIRLPGTDVARRPARIYLDRAGGGIVSIVWCCKRRVVLTEFRNAVPGLLQKTVGPATLVEPVEVGGESGLWVDGADHVVRVITATGSWPERSLRVHGGVLIWTSRGVTLRLEGDLTRAEALAFAAHIR